MYGLKALAAGDLSTSIGKLIKIRRFRNHHKFTYQAARSFSTIRQRGLNLPVRDRFGNMLGMLAEACTFLANGVQK